jgi:catechol 2,3-dioxygenase-like lactoylglutathione lyase family enzyme
VIQSGGLTAQEKREDMQTTSTLPLPFLQNGVAQIGILVKDLERTVELYWKVFGIGPWHFYTYGKPLVKEMTYQGKPASYHMRLALASLGPTRIELIELGEGPTIYADFVREHSYGTQHIGVLVDDMQAALQQAETAGIKMIQDGSGFGLDGDGHYAYLDTQADFGVTIELIERPSKRIKPDKVYPPEE